MITNAVSCLVFYERNRIDTLGSANHVRTMFLVADIAK